MTNSNAIQCLLLRAFLQFRAVKTSLALREALLQLNIDHTIGIATGSVYVGSVGNQRRQEHAGLCSSLAAHRSSA